MNFHVFMSLLFVSFTSLLASAETNFCQLTSQAALTACRSGGQGDYWVAIGKCDNLSDPAQQNACKQQASTDLNTAKQDCNDQFAVRQTACQRLGDDPYDPVINPADFISTIDNPYFPLAPGTTYIYDGTTGGAKVHVEFAVTRKRVKILGVNTVAVHDKVFPDGANTEDTLDWFAQDFSGNVCYLGENTEELIGGRPSSLAGTFTAGVNGAKAGIIMEAHSVIGDFYRQEFALDEAEDFADVKRLSDTITVPAGKFTNCLRTDETTPLEPSLHEAKWYATGVGNILTKDLVTGETIKLTRIEHH